MRVTLGLMIGSFFLGGISNSPIIASKRPRYVCKPYVEVVVSSDPKYKIGDSICEGQKVLLSSPIKVHCLNSPKIVTITKTDDLVLCDLPKASVRRCAQSDQSPACIGVDRGKFEEKPSLIQPYSEVLLSTKPYFKWLPLKNATRYVLNVWNKRQDWSFETTNTQMYWPTSALQLTKGETYQVAVQAYQGKHLLSTSIGAINILRKEKTLEIEDALATARRISPIEEQIKAVYSAYNKFNLVDNEIEYLEKCRQRYRLPVIYRLLGHAYVEAGFMERSLPLFKNAIEIASEIHDEIEKRAASDALQELATLDHRQEPTRTIEPQK